MTGAKILLVDDDMEFRNLMRTLLEAARYEVIEAANGLRLVSLLQASRPALILLDGRLSWMDGLELCQALHQNPSFSQIPVCMVSARAGLADQKRGLACGAVDYICKPIDPQSFLQRVAGIIERCASVPPPCDAALAEDHSWAL